MCRYGISSIYRQHYACFECRKMFRPTFEMKAEQTAPGIVFLCPECKRPMHNVGRDFKAPKQSDKRQWEKVRILWHKGIRWDSCGCGPGHNYRTVNDAKRYKRPYPGYAFRSKFIFAGAYEKT
jgi:hypothetical protein